MDFAGVGGHAEVGLYGSKGRARVTMRKWVVDEHIIINSYVTQYVMMYRGL